MQHIKKRESIRITKSTVSSIQTGFKRQISPPLKKRDENLEITYKRLLKNRNIGICVKAKSKKTSSIPEYSSDALEAIGGINVIGSGFIAKL